MQVKDYAKKLIIADCIDLLDSIFNVGEKDRSVFSLGIIPYICLVTNEAYDWCKKDKVTIDIFNSKNLLENIRAKAKLFSKDKLMSYQDQVMEYENTVKTEHMYYKNLALIFAPDFLIDDIGVYTINNLFIGNTIQYSYDFSIFKNNNDPIYNLKKEIKMFYEEIGECLQNIITELSGNEYEIIYNTTNFKYHDTRDFNFKRTFKNIENLLVFSLICRINFILHFLKQSLRKNSMLYLRILYITFYSIKDDLDNLNVNYSNIYNQYYDRYFRNSMAHYSLYKKIDINDVFPNEIGFGLVEKYFSKNYLEFVEIIEIKLEQILQLLECKFTIN